MALHAVPGGSGGGSGVTNIPQYNSDPSAPSAGDVWVVKEPASSPIGLLLSLTYAAVHYTLNYRTSEGTTVRISFN